MAEGIEFEKSITRDWCLINTELHQESFTTEFEKQFGWRFTDVIYEGVNGSVTVYYPQVEYIDQMRDFVISKLNKEKSWLHDQATAIKEKTIETEKWLNQVTAESLKVQSSSDLNKFFLKFVNENHEIWPRFLLILMFPIHMENHLQAKNYSEPVYGAIEVRKKIENLGPLLDNIGTEFAKVILRRVDYPEPLARYVSYKELLGYLSRNTVPDKAILEAREKYFIVTNEGVSTTSLDKYLNKHSYRLKDGTPITSEGLKGNTAYPGLISGKVKLVLNKNMFTKIEEGDILVTSMTTPDFLPIMQKAAAFITDEGGVTCHAAIIAREMKKPCIIGTKIATKVLKDGDTVEVDAEKGIIKILS